MFDCSQHIPPTKYPPIKTTKHIKCHYKRSDLSIINTIRLHTTYIAQYTLPTVLLISHHYTRRIHDHTTTSRYLLPSTPTTYTTRHTQCLTNICQSVINVPAFVLLGCWCVSEWRKRATVRRLTARCSHCGACLIVLGCLQYARTI